MIHIAQPENAIWWFNEAISNGLSDFDKRIMIVETAYPHTLQDADNANNLLGESTLIQGYPASPQGQLNDMITLTINALRGGCEGIIYWEPAWISTDCFTQWGQGSHWDNASFFDAFDENEALPAFDFFSREYQ